jgi:hypothetical protein
MAIELNGLRIAFIICNEGIDPAELVESISQIHA